MKYIILFEYMDGKTFKVEVDRADMADFVDAVNTGDVFFSSSRGVGMWLPIDKIRHFKVEMVDEHGERVTEGASTEEPVAGSEALPAHIDISKNL